MHNCFLSLSVNPHWGSCYKIKKISINWNINSSTAQTMPAHLYGNQRCSVASCNLVNERVTLLGGNVCGGTSKHSRLRHENISLKQEQRVDQQMWCQTISQCSISDCDISNSATRSLLEREGFGYLSMPSSSIIQFKCCFSLLLILQQHSNLSVIPIV